MPEAGTDTPEELRDRTYRKEVSGYTPYNSRGRRRMGVWRYEKQTQQQADDSKSIL